MASLTAHLVESGGHGRLGFHPSCPVCCRERLFGSLASDAVVSRRTQAALASGVLALSAMGPAVAMAQEADQQLEGGSGAGQPQGGGETGSGAVAAPGSDTSGGTVPPTEVVPPTAPDLDPLTPPEADEGSVLQDVVPVETDPIAAPSTHPAPPPRLDEDGAPEAGTDLPQPAPEPGVAEPDSPVEAPELVPAEAEGSETLDGSEPSAPADHPDGKARAEQTEKDKPRADSQPPPEGPSAPRPAAVQTPTAATTAAPVEAAPPDAPLQTAPAINPASPPPASTPGGRFLVVQPGDSLWAIAKRLLGPNASPAELARKVNRLWELNRERIGTGRPDLLLVGTKLRLR
jgi:LysM domain